MSTTKSNAVKSRHIDLDDPKSRAALAKLVRRSPTTEWSLWASADDGWKVYFKRSRYDKDLGSMEEDLIVEASTPVLIGGSTGKVRPFSDPDADEVIVPQCKYISLRGGDAVAAAKLLSRRFRLHVRHSHGSVSSSKHGLAFLYLRLESIASGESFQIGHETVTKDGSRIIIGACGT